MQISCKLRARKHCPRYKFLGARNTFVAAIGAQNDGQGSFFKDSHATLLWCERCQNGLLTPFCAPRSPPLYGACTKKRSSEGRNRHLAPTGRSQMESNARSSRYFSTTGPPMQQRATAGTSATTGDVVTDVRWRRQRLWWPTGRRRRGRGEGAAPLPGSGHPGSVPDPPRPARGSRGRPDWRARDGAGAPERARQATADRAPRGGCSALRVGRFSPLVCNDRLRGLDMHGGNHLHWLVTARVNSYLGKLGPGDDYRPFRKKGDDGRRHRRRQQVNRVSMSWCFNRTDFPHLESHSGCRARG